MNKWLFLHLPTLVSDTGTQRYVLRQLAQDFYQDVAQIALIPPAGLLFEVRSLLRLYGSLAHLVEHLEQRLSAQGLQGCLASGFSPLSARLLAQAQIGIIAEAKAPVLAQLQALPLYAAGLEAQVERRLTGVGLHTIGDLLALPSTALNQRFGKKMAHYLAELRGERQMPQHYYRPAPYFYQRVDLNAEMTEWTRMLFVLKRILQSLERFLCERQLATRELLIEALHRDKSTTPLVIRFAHDVWQAESMLSLCQLFMARQPLAQPALELSVKVTRLRAMQATPQDMLQQKAAHWSLAELWSRLAARLGADAIYMQSITTEVRPELAQQRMPVGKNSVSVQTALLPRPLWLLTEPEPIAIKDYQCHWGPERIDSGWWDAEPQQRDYYIAVDAAARQAWLFQDQRGWFLHGWFA